MGQANESNVRIYVYVYYKLEASYTNEFVALNNVARLRRLYGDDAVTVKRV